jgi:hypothetical protein
MAEFFMVEGRSVAQATPGKPRFSDESSWPRLAARHYLFSSFKISRAAFAPEPPVRPAPGWVPLPQR